MVHLTTPVMKLYMYRGLQECKEKDTFSTPHFRYTSYTTSTTPLLHPNKIDICRTILRDRFQNGKVGQV